MSIEVFVVLAIITMVAIRAIHGYVTYFKSYKRTIEMYWKLRNENRELQQKCWNLEKQIKWHI